MRKITRKEYREDIGEKAEWVFEKLVDPDDETDRNDLVHEAVGDDQWVVYYRYHDDVAHHTDHPDAVKNISEHPSPEDQAYCSMVEDVHAALQKVDEDIEEYLDLLQEGDHEDAAYTRERILRRLAG